MEGKDDSNLNQGRLSGRIQETFSRESPWELLIAEEGCIKRKRDMVQGDWKYFSSLFPTHFSIIDFRQS